MQTDYLDWQAYLLVVGMSFWPFIVHEIAKVVISTIGVQCVLIVQI
jgi:hypothetical protein